MTRLWVRLCVALAPLTAAIAVATVGIWLLLPRGDDSVAAGVRFGRVTAGPEDRAADLVRARGEELLDRRIRLMHRGELVSDSTLRDLGASVDDEAVLASLRAVGRAGSIIERLDAVWQARRGNVAVAMPVRLPLEPLAAKLEVFKAEHDKPPQPSRWDFQADRPTDHHDGMLVDVLAAADALLAAAEEGRATAALPVRATAPTATREAVAKVDRSEVVSHYETRFAFVGNQANRAGNIERAASALDGLVMMPSDLVSFNELVGPRSEDNGFYEAGEIYRGEMRTGVGGGTCQVASTFHAAAFFAGLEVLERSPHSRPSGYIGIGLDATVAYPHVDLKMKNPYAFAVVVHAYADQGTLHIDLLGAERPATVDYAAATIGVRPYERKVRETPWLPEGKVIRKQKGIRGVTIAKTRLIHYSDGSEKAERSVDVYPPTNEVYYVPTGADLEELLPPLPEDAVPGDAAG